MDSVTRSNHNPGSGRDKAQGFVDAVRKHPSVILGYFMSRSDELKKADLKVAAAILSYADESKKKDMSSEMFSSLALPVYAKAMFDGLGGGGAVIDAFLKMKPGKGVSEGDVEKIIGALLVMADEQFGEGSNRWTELHNSSQNMLRISRV